MGELEWFYNMLVNSGCVAEDASKATAFVGVLITFSLLQAFKWLFSAKR